MLQNSFRKKLENKKTHSYYSISSSFVGFHLCLQCFLIVLRPFLASPERLNFLWLATQMDTIPRNRGGQMRYFLCCCSNFFFFLFFYWMNKIEYQSVLCSAVKNKSFVAFLQLNRKMDFGQAKVLSIYFYIEVN